MALPLLIDTSPGNTTDTPRRLRVWVAGDSGILGSKTSYPTSGSQSSPGNTGNGNFLKALASREFLKSHHQGEPEWLWGMGAQGISEKFL